MAPAARWALGLAPAALIALAGCAEDPFDGRSSCAATAPLFNASTDSGVLALRPGQELAIAALRRDSADPVQCSATLIGGALGITAAHCATQKLLELRQLRLPRSLPVFWLGTHPELDVALFQVDPTLLDGSDLEPIPLFAGAIDESFVGERLTLAGLGITETGATGELRFVEEQVMQVTENEIWVDGMGVTGACGGDSGGPILVRDADGEPRVAGVLDRGSADCLGLDVYSRADRLREWVRETDEATAPEVEDTCGSGR